MHSTHLSPRKQWVAPAILFMCSFAQAAAASQKTPSLGAVTTQNRKDGICCDSAHGGVYQTFGRGLCP